MILALDLTSDSNKELKLLAYEKLHKKRRECPNLSFYKVLCLCSTERGF
jgi:hypothetical protein